MATAVKKATRRTKVQTPVKSHSSYWLQEDDFLDDDTTADDKSAANLNRLLRLAGIRRGVANFVSILSGKNVPVKFSDGNDSFTDGEHVTIAADDNPKNFDVMVGLALHEGSHILLSDFSFRKTIAKLQQSVSRYRVPLEYNALISRETGSVSTVRAKNAYTTVLTDMLHPDLANRFPADPYSWTEYEFNAADRILGDLLDIMNILEDRRIDKYVYRSAEGYRPYYDALYNKYFLNKDITKGLKEDPALLEATIDNYINRLLLSIHPEANHDALPGLRDIVEMMNIQDIDRIAPENDVRFDTNNLPVWMFNSNFNTMPVIWREANKIYVEILKHAPLTVKTAVDEKNAEDGEGTSAPNGESSPDGEQRETSKEGTGAGSSTSPGETPSSDSDSDSEEKSDPAPTSKQDKPFNSAKTQKAIDEAKRVLRGSVKKKRITKKDNESINAMEESDGSLVDVKNGKLPSARVLVTKKMSPALMEQEWFIFGSRMNGYVSSRTEEAIAAGRRMGAILHSRLQVRNDPVYTRQTRLPQGKIDRRLLSQLGMELTSVFSRTTVDTHKPAMLHLTLDASGSMSGRPWEKVLTVATALAYVGTKVQNIDVVITIRGGTSVAIVSVIFDSRKDTFASFTKYARYLSPAGSTPEGLCFAAVKDIILDSKNTHDVYFINFSDGMPGFSYSVAGTFTNNPMGGWGRNYVGYSGEDAINQTRQIVNELRDNGINVLSYYIAEYYANEATKRDFSRMYGADAVNVDVSNVTQVLQTLNKKLLVRG